MSHVTRHLLHLLADASDRQSARIDLSQRSCSVAVGRVHGLCRRLQQVKD